MQKILLKKHNKDFSIDKIDYTDKGVFDAISTGRCDGIFQPESAGMKSFMKELKPSNLEDLIAGISLYRPGPMDFIPQYIEGKNNQQNVTYACPQLEPILKPTYGCIVYQEQVMQIVMKLAAMILAEVTWCAEPCPRKKPMLCQGAPVFCLRQ